MKQYNKEELLYTFSTFADFRGMLTSVENHKCLPFEIERVFWIYDVPNFARRGGHAHSSCDELLVAISGYFDVTIDDGTNQYTYHLNNPRIGVHIPANVWCELENFSEHCVCLVLASQTYTDEGYINNYDEFKKLSSSE